MYRVLQAGYEMGIPSNWTRWGVERNHNIHYPTWSVRYKRLIYGVASAPEIYQKIVLDTLAGNPSTANIGDDRIIGVIGMEDLDRNLFEALDKLGTAGFTLNGKECKFHMPRLTFFGYDLSARGLAPSEEKFAAVVNAGAPKDAAEVRSFLGLVQYSSKFLPDYALVAEPLRELTQENVKFRWGVKQQEVFTKLKEMITEIRTLTYFKNDCRTRIVADAGPHGLGAILTQQQDGVWCVVSYTSRSLTEMERRYSQTEKEALA